LIALTKDSKEWLLPASQRFPGCTIRQCRRIVRGGGNEQRKLACSRLVALIGERGIVGCSHLGWHFVDTGYLDDLACTKNRCQLRKALPVQKTFSRRGITGGQKGVGSDDARKTLFVFGSQAQPDEAAPILAYQRDPLQIPRQDQTAYPINVALVGIVLAV